MKQEFVFADSIIESAELLSNAVITSTYAAEPPILYMDLGNAESKYNYGSRTVALDLSWFARYKPTTDRLISAVLWAFFIWRVFVLLPGIINGTGGMVGSVQDHDIRQEKANKKKGD